MKMKLILTLNCDSPTSAPIPEYNKYSSTSILIINNGRPPINQHIFFKIKHQILHPIVLTKDENNHHNLIDQTLENTQININAYLLNPNHSHKWIHYQHKVILPLSYMLTLHLIIVSSLRNFPNSNFDLIQQIYLPIFNKTNIQNIIIIKYIIDTLSLKYTLEYFMLNILQLKRCNIILFIPIPLSYTLYQLNMVYLTYFPLSPLYNCSYYDNFPSLFLILNLCKLYFILLLLFMYSFLFSPLLKPCIPLTSYN